MLGSASVANIKLRSHAEFVDTIYVNWWLLYLLPSSCIPFSTALIGRFAHPPLSVCIYCFNRRLLPPLRTG